MSCRVHGPFARCECGYARFFAGLAVLGLVLTSCGLLATPAEPCSSKDAQMAAKAADCVARVGAACKGIPLDEPCPFEEECRAYSAERCK